MAIATSGLVYYYNSKQGASSTQWLDLSGNAYHLNSTNVLIETDGVYYSGTDTSRSALSFTTSIPIQTDFTVEVCVKLPDLTNSGYILSGYVSGSSAAYRAVSFNSDQVFRVQDGISSKVSGYYGRIGEHTTYTIKRVSATSVALYINGIFERNFAVEQDYKGVSGELVIGTDDGGGNFKGHIAFARQYNRSLTDEEIYNNSLYGREVGLTNYNIVTTTHFPSTYYTTSNHWVNPTDSYSENNVNASIPVPISTTSYLVLGGFNFAIPTDATITSLVAEVKWYVAGTGTIVSTMGLQSYSEVDELERGYELVNPISPTSAVVQKFADHGVWTISELNNTTSTEFKMAVRASRTTSTVNYTMYVDYVKMIVTYILTSSSDPPIVTVSNMTRSKIGKATGSDRSTVTFKFDIAVTEWVVRVMGSSHDTGAIADSGGALAANTNATAEIDWTECYQEGNNRVNIYGKSASGVWTQYAN